MKWWWLIAFIVFAFLGAWLFSGRAFKNTERAIRFHTEGWHEALRKASSYKPKPYVAFFDKRSSSKYYHDMMNEHERALLGMGYLTNRVIRLTNQVITREFSSNFFRQIHMRFGTNTDQVWSCPYLPTRDGIAPTLPTKDVGEWERIFRECAARYASNTVPPLTNSNK